jgi:predicted SnoaL-like aldol condensation-catalyzing enzyme
MRQRTNFAFLALLLGVASAIPRAYGVGPNSVQSAAERLSPMSQDSAMTDLFDRWEQVWNEGKFDLARSCLAESYIRHDPKGDRTVTRDAYAAEIAAIHKDRPDIRVVVYDHSFSGDRAWFRFAFKWTDAKTGEAQTQAGMQVYWIVNGKLAETWISVLPVGTVWTDTPQLHWTGRASK